MQCRHQCLNCEIIKHFSNESRKPQKLKSDTVFIRFHPIFIQHVSTVKYNKSISKIKGLEKLAANLM